MDGLFRQFGLLARLPRLPLALVAAMLAIALWIEFTDPHPVLWLPKIPLALLLVWAATRPAPSPSGVSAPANERGGE